MWCNKRIRDENVASNDETTSNDTGLTTVKNEMNDNNNTTNKVISSNKPNQSVAEPKLGHVHSWTEVKKHIPFQ